MAFAPASGPLPTYDDACSALLEAIYTFLDDTMLTAGHKIRQDAGALLGLLRAYGVERPDTEQVDSAPVCGGFGRIPPPEGPAPDPQMIVTSK
jgi:hypothetical protein